MGGTTFDLSAQKRYAQPDDIEIGSLFLFLVSVSTMSFLFGRKTTAIKLSSLNYARALVLGLYISSWLFSFSSAILAQTNNGNFVSCTVANFFCIFLYAGSKIFIYLFLVERAHVVTAVGVTRWNSRLFKFNIALIAPFSIIVALAIIYRISVIDDNGHCILGIRQSASIPLMAYDTLINIWLTALFIRALISSTSHLQGPTKSKLRSLALRTLIGSIFSLIFSAANIASIAVFDGHERGVLCLTLCALDVTLNAVTIHWITSPRDDSVSKSSMRNTSVNGDRTSMLRPQFAMTSREKQVQPFESHISVSIESYVEEYHQLHIADRSTLDRSAIK